MKIYRTVNPVAYENTYYLENGHSLILVDPGSDWATIQKQIDRIGKPIVAILLTHTHYDHIMSLEKVRQTYHFPPVYVHSAEASWLSSPVDNLSGLDRHADLEDVVCKEADFLYDIRSDYQIADFHFYVLETPGHSAGGVSIVFPEDHLVLSGDALFAKPLDGPIFQQGTRHSYLAVSEKNSLPFHLPTLSIPGMALRLLLVTRRCSIPSLDNPKESLSSFLSS